MLEFPGQVLELSMLVGRGTKGLLGHLWVQAWTDNDYLTLRTLLRALFDIIISSGHSPEELFLRSGNSPASDCQHFLLSHLLQDHWSDFFKTWSECSLNV